MKWYLCFEKKREELAAVARQSKKVTKTVSFKKWMKATWIPVVGKNLECYCCEGELDCAVQNSSELWSPGSFHMYVHTYISGAQETSPIPIVKI